MIKCYVCGSVVDLEPLTLEWMAPRGFKMKMSAWKCQKCIKEAEALINWKPTKKWIRETIDMLDAKTGK